MHLAAFTGEQTVVVTGDFISAHWTQLVQSHIMSILHPEKGNITRVSFPTMTHITQIIK